MSHHPAPVGLGGQKGGHVGHAGIVGKANTGHHSFICKPSPMGIHIKVGSFPGASGAQFNGLAIHEPHPNPQENHLIRKSSCPESSSTTCDISS